ncbi:MAG: hypothetical protein HAW62_05230 [Endozoicomonadaceae bacterium]|nr:hypothetical protein [Endozoicomonadaceae bacterium]
MQFLLETAQPFIKPFNQYIHQLGGVRKIFETMIASNTSISVMKQLDEMNLISCHTLSLGQHCSLNEEPQRYFNILNDINPIWIGLLTSSIIILPNVVSYLARTCLDQDENFHDMERKELTKEHKKNIITLKTQHLTQYDQSDQLYQIKEARWRSASTFTFHMNPIIILGALTIGAHYLFSTPFVMLDCLYSVTASVITTSCISLIAFIRYKKESSQLAQHKIAYQYATQCTEKVSESPILKIKIQDLSQKLLHTLKQFQQDTPSTKQTQLTGLYHQKPEFYCDMKKKIYQLIQDLIDRIQKDVALGFLENKNSIAHQVLLYNMGIENLVTEFKEHMQPIKSTMPEIDLDPLSKQLETAQKYVTEEEEGEKQEIDLLLETIDCITTQMTILTQKNNQLKSIKDQQENHLIRQQKIDIFSQNSVQ